MQLGGLGRGGASGVVAGTYGGATSIPVLVVDAKGRITGVTAQALTSVFTLSFESSELGWAVSTLYSASHGLGGIPKAAYAVARCKTADLGYAVGDEIVFQNYQNPNDYSGVMCNATTINWFAGPGNVVTNWATGGPGSLTIANWKIVLRAYR